MLNHYFKCEFVEFLDVCSLRSENKMSCNSCIYKDVCNEMTNSFFIGHPFSYRKSIYDKLQWSKLPDLKCLDSLEDSNITM